MTLFDRLLKRKDITSADSRSEKGNARNEAEHMLEKGLSLEIQGLPEEALQCYAAAVRMAPDLALAHFNQGNILLDQGDAQGALSAYEKAIAYKPDSAALHYNMGNAHLRLGNTDAGVAACRKAILLKPDLADAHITLGVALGNLGQHLAAIACYQRALEINPSSAEIHSNVGIAMMELDRFEEAVGNFDKALALRPDYVDALKNRGIALQHLGQFDEAAASYHRALAVDSQLAEIHTNLGSTLKELGKFEEAIASYRHALAINPTLAAAHHNLGLTLQANGQPDRAVASHLQAIEVDPDYVPAYNSMGAALGDLGQHEKAITYFRHAIRLQPDSMDGHFNLGITLAAGGQLHAAMESFHRALKIHPDNADSHVGLANVLKGLGEFTSALKSVRRALELDPDCVIAHNNLLFIHNYVADQPAELLLADAQRFGNMAARLAQPYTDWPNSPDRERCLRVGFVSGDLCDHPVGYFLDGVLAALSSQASRRLELFGYPNRSYDDATSQRLKANCTGWHPTTWLSDEAVAQRIRDDGIDILIDLSGHTAHNRLSVFAWKPAPVQVSWLGYFATTGVAAIDYFVADPWTLLPDQEAHFSEQIWRLPETRLCFTPPAADIAVNELPALTNGYVTFGCFNNLSKMNDAVVALWARVLHAVPGSRLFLKYQQLAEASVRQRTCDRFAIHGIEPGRLIFEDYGPRADYLAAYRHVDIALDPFPFPGGTTTVEALWMGIPVLTLAGQRFLSRQGVGLLINAGLPEWVAADANDYVARAVSHCADLQRLASLRNGLRQQVLDSPIFDAPRFAHHFETALRSMWHIWCAAQPPQT